jgi:hypothetical protein
MRFSAYRDEEDVTAQASWSVGILQKQLAVLPPNSEDVKLNPG